MGPSFEPRMPTSCAPSHRPRPRAAGPVDRLAPALALAVALLFLFSPIAFGPDGSAAAPATSARPVVASGAAPAPSSISLSALPGTASTTEMAYDGASGTMVLVAPGVGSGGAALSQSITYEQVDGAWERLSTPTAPSSREYAAMAYDAGIGKILLFGGYSSRGGFLNDTWEFSGGTWTNVTASAGTAPSPRAAADLAYDGNGSFDLLFGGYGPTGSATAGNLTDTWEFEDGTWSAVETSTSPPLEGSMAYDAALGAVVYVGGVALVGCSPLTYAFVDGEWLDLAAEVGLAPELAMSALAYDPAISGLLLFGGVCGVGIAGIGITLDLSDSTYELTSSGWSAVSASGAPSARYGADLAYDDASGAMVLFGGENAVLVLGGSPVGHLLASTFTFSGGTWSPVGPELTVNRPIAEVGQNLSFSVVGAVTPGPTVYAYTGLPAGTNGSGPVVNLTAESTGRLNVTVEVTTQLGFASASSATENASGSATIVARHWASPLNESRNTTEVGVAVALWASVGGGYGNTSDAFLGLPAGCLSPDAATVTCTPAVPGTFEITFASTDALGVEASSVADLTVAPRLAVAAMELLRPAIDLGMSMNATMVSDGGVGPYLVSYPSLPEGCASANASELGCVPSATGTFTVSGRMSDALGVQANATTTLTVNPDPQVASFAFVGANLTVGIDTTFRAAVTVTGGTGAVLTTLSGLPPGCAYTPLADLPVDCQPTVAGTFEVTATATDELGWTASAKANLTVEAAPPPGGKTVVPGFAYGSFLEGVGVVAVVGAIAAVAIGAQASARRKEREALASELEAGVAGAPTDLGGHPTGIRGPPRPPV